MGVVAVNTFNITARDHIVHTCSHTLFIVAFHANCTFFRLQQSGIAAGMGIMTKEAGGGRHRPMDIFPLDKILMTNEAKVFDLCTDKTARLGPGMAIIAMLVPVRRMLRPRLHWGRAHRLAITTRKSRREPLLGIFFANLPGRGRTGDSVEDRRQHFVAVDGIASSEKNTKEKSHKDCEITLFHQDYFPLTGSPESLPWSAAAGNVALSAMAPRP